MPAAIASEWRPAAGMQEGVMAERWRLVYIEHDTGVRVIQYWESAEQALREAHNMLKATR